MVIQKVRSNAGVICNLVLFMGLFATSISAIPVQMSVAGNIEYPIKIACECEYSLYVDGKYIESDKTEVKSFDYLETGWNSTKRFYPYIHEKSPKIIAFNGVGNQHSGFLNGFIMDMNNGADYTKYQEWKCKDFSKTVEKTPSTNWFTYDYDDSDWSISTSYGANYQNNSFQIFETERREIHLQAEWLWTKDNSDGNIYCRKKNTATSPLPSVIITTTAPPPVTTTAEPTHVSTTIHRPSTTALPKHVSTTIHHPPTTAAPPRVSTTIHHPPTTATHTRVPTTIHHPPTTALPTHLPTTIHHPPTTATHTHVSTTATHPHVPTTATHPRVPTTIHRPSTTAAPTHVPTTIHRPSTTAAPTHVPTTIHHPPTTATHPHVPTTIHHPPTTATHPHVSTMIHRPSTTAAPPHVPTTAAPPHVPTTIHNTISPINIKIVINNIKYSKGISDQQIAHLLENVKFYRDNNNQQNTEYDHNSLYRTVLTARLRIIRHYENLIRHFERLEHLERKSYDEHADNTDNADNYNDHTDSESSESNTSKSNIIQSMIKLNSHIKSIENSIHFIKGNHKYLLLRLLKNLKQQYEKDTMKIFNI
jgi:hypothetical protein